MIIQVQHDKVSTFKPKGKDKDPKQYIVKTPLIENYGGIHCKQILLRREITFTQNMSSSPYTITLFEVIDGQKIIAVNFIPFVKIIKKGVGPTGHTPAEVGSLISVLQSRLLMYNNRKGLEWVCNSGTDGFGYNTETIEVLATIYLSDVSTETLRTSGTKKWT